MSGVPPADPAGYRVERFEPVALSLEELTRMATLQQTLKHERAPNDPLTPLDAFESWMRNPITGGWRAFFRALDGKGRLVGWGLVTRTLNDEKNPNLRGWEIAVLPGHRRRGIGRALLRNIVEAVQDQGGEIVFAAQSTDRIPANTLFAKAIGATAGLEMKSNELDLAKVDPEQVARWAAQAPAGYRLERIDREIPAALLAPYLHASRAMNDMPHGDLHVDTSGISERQVRDREASYRTSGDSWWILLALHVQTGEGAGLTEVTWNPRIPHAVIQFATGVVARHRGHRIGMWLKAAMLKRILEEVPQAKVIRTTNAHVNAHMLALNTELGFVPASRVTVWELTLAAARTAVGLHGARK